MTMTTLKKFGLAAFVADRASMDTVGTGIQIDWTKFTDAKYGPAGKRRIPAGTAIEPIGTGAADSPRYLCGPASGTAGKDAWLTKQAIEEDAEWPTGHGAYNGGNVYEALLPDASGAPRVLAAGLKAQLVAVGFKFLVSEDKR